MNDTADLMCAHCGHGLRFHGELLASCEACREEVERGELDFECADFDH